MLQYVKTHVLTCSKQNEKETQMETYSQCLGLKAYHPDEIGDIQDYLKAKAEEFGLDEYTWMEAWQNAEQTAIETNNFEDYIKDGYTWIEIFKRCAFDSLVGLR